MFIKYQFAKIELQTLILIKLTKFTNIKNPLEKKFRKAGVLPKKNGTYLFDYY